MPPHAVADLKLSAAYAVFLGSYLVFALGKFPGMKIDRPGAGVIGAVLMVAFRILQPGDALRHIDFSTIVLLFSMMLIVAYLHLAGLFERSAVRLPSAPLSRDRHPDRAQHCLLDLYHPTRREGVAQRSRDETIAAQRRDLLTLCHGGAAQSALASSQSHVGRGLTEHAR